MHVVVEGVENEQQKEFLLRRGCHALQGYLFSAPQLVEHWLEAIEQEDGAQP
ncbi:MAG: EAL domain-containing protein [Alcaligenes sp.]